MMYLNYDWHGHYDVLSVPYSYPHYDDMEMVTFVLMAVQTTVVPAVSGRSI